ncbi:MFS general substrate transporter [Aspergillus lucknowensis]|uniref:MFS general substrate transporter n=1 Tax=Aspergillus lucknowensis TaxID=176173 RepID=A0ABR4LVR1_9EURO
MSTTTTLAVPTPPELSGSVTPRSDTSEKKEVLSKPLNVADLSELEPSRNATDASPRDIHGLKWALVVMSIFSCVFLFALDNTIVADVQPAIIDDFHDLAKLPWLSVAFLLGAASTLLVWSKGYGLFNCKWLYIGTTAIFEVGSAVCGAAPNMDSLIVGRAICGLGGAGMYLGVMTILSILTTPTERPMYLGGTGLIWGTGTVLGPIIGGAFADSSATWRWAFYINLCIGALFAPVFFLMIPSIDPRPGVPIRARLAEIDWLGPILFVGGYVSGIMAIAFGGALYAWSDSRIIGMFVCSGVLFILFFLQQGYQVFTSYMGRTFPMQYLKNKEMMLLFVETAAAGTSSFVPIYFIPLYFQFVKGDGALEAGVRLLPFIVPMVVFNLVNGVGMSALGYYMPWYLGGGILVIVGGVLLQIVDLSTNVAQIYGALVVGGIGTGVFSQASFSVAQSLVAVEEIPMAVGFITCAQVGGSAIALSIANTVFLNRATVQITNLLPDVSRDEVQAMISGANSRLLDSLGEAVRTDVLAAIVDSISDAFVLDLTAGCVAVLLALFLRRTKMVHQAGAGGGM